MESVGDRHGRSLAALGMLEKGATALVGAALVVGQPTIDTTHVGHADEDAARGVRLELQHHLLARDVQVVVGQGGLATQGHALADGHANCRGNSN